MLQDDSARVPVSSWHGSRTIALVGLALLTVARPGAAQTPQNQTTPMKLDAAIARALDVYPAVQVASNQAASALANVAVARLPYWPRLDLLWQENRATRNNVFGLLLPQAVVPPISGPVQASSITSTTDRTFVVRVRAGKTEWIDVRTGLASGRCSATNALEHTVGARPRLRRGPLLNAGVRR